MKAETCVFSGYKIYLRDTASAMSTPDSKDVHADENVQKKRVKRNVQMASRPIENVTVEASLAKRNQFRKFRKAQREQVINAAKETIRKEKADKKKEKHSTCYASSA